MTLWFSIGCLFGLAAGLILGWVWRNRVRAPDHTAFMAYLEILDAAFERETLT